jgi:hypothetical protein
MGGGEGCCDLPRRAGPQDVRASGPNLASPRVCSTDANFVIVEGKERAPVPTLEQLRRGMPWCWIMCKRCLHRTPASRTLANLLRRPVLLLASLAGAIKRQVAAYSEVNRVLLRSRTRRRGASLASPIAT